MNDHLITDCRQVQSLLRRVGYSAPLNGEVDLQTQRSLRAFQRDLRLSPTGVVDDHTLSVLEHCVQNLRPEVR